MRKKKFNRVLVVLGGTSGERAISLESGRACIKALKKKGYKVSGSDIDYSNDLKKLKNDGAIVYEGHHENNIKDKDLLVVSSAIDSENVELLQAKKTLSQ